jgi:hypothetical protein
VLAGKCEQVRTARILKKLFEFGVELILDAEQQGLSEGTGLARSHRYAPGKMPCEQRP